MQCMCWTGKVSTSLSCNVLFRYTMANVEKLLKSLEVLRISPGTSGNDDFSLK